MNLLKIDKTNEVVWHKLKYHKGDRVNLSPHLSYKWAHQVQKQS